MATDSPDAAAPAQPVKRFGTFLGVYVPSVLTILGVMMYLRFGWVVGNVGLPLTLLIVLMASSITFVTGLSASAIANNMKVGVGGEYFMVSRSLGLELGGAIGIPLFLCRTLSLTLYSFGLAESMGFLWPEAWGAPPIQFLAAGIIIATTAIAGRSADAALKLQIPIMIGVGLSLLALVGGVLSGPSVTPEMVPHYERSAEGGFWLVFAVFFPAVTGFTAGIGMSGDLKDPKRSIPRGTILAVVTGTVVYVGIVFLLALTGKVTALELSVLDPQVPPIWTKIAWLGMWTVFPGMWGAILSSAFGSALGGPRVLQALASDRLAPRWLARTSKTGQPAIATWTTGGIALAAVALGDLNTVGRWVTVFFLTLYVAINVSAALEKLVGDPSYRPTINIPWIVSLAGAAGALVVMFLINPVVCACAIGLELLLYLYLKSRGFESTWGDVRGGLWNAVARMALLKARTIKLEARNWRPNILLFTANPGSRLGLVRMANWFNQNRGVVTVCQAVVGDLARHEYDIKAMRQEMEQAIDEEGLVAFSEVDIVPEFHSGVIGIAQANGFAGMQSNTVMFGWPGSSQGLAKLLRVSRALTRINKNTILCKLPRAAGPLTRSRIDVWWRGREYNGDLMVLLAHLLNQNQSWHRAEVHVRTIVDSEADRAEMAQKLTELIAEARITAHTDVIVRENGRPIPELMREASHDASVVFLGLRTPREGEAEEVAVQMQTMADQFQSTIFVRNAGPFAGQLI